MKEELENIIKTFEAVGPLVGNALKSGQLFNLREDPAESNDLSSQYPELRTELINAYDEYEQNVGVIFDPIDMSIVKEKEW